MKDVETLIYSRLSTDAALLALIGSSDNLIHAFQNIKPKKNQVTFWNVASIKGVFQTDVTYLQDIVYAFSIFHNDYLDICGRIKALFNNKHFDPQPGYTEADCIESFFEQDEPDEYDEELKVKRKVCRVRFLVRLKPFNPTI